MDLVISPRMFTNVAVSSRANSMLAQALRLLCFQSTFFIITLFSLFQFHLLQSLNKKLLDL